MLLEFFSLQIMHADSNTSLTAVGRSWGTGTVMVDTQGWRRALPQCACCPTGGWLSIREQVSSRCPRGARRCEFICPDQKLVNSFFYWWHTLLSIWQQLNTVYFLLGHFLHVSVPCDASNLLAAPPETGPWSTANIEIMGDTSCRMKRNLVIVFWEIVFISWHLLQDCTRPFCLGVFQPMAAGQSSSLQVNRLSRKASGNIQELQSPWKWLPPTWSSQPLLPTFSNVMWAC